MENKKIIGIMACDPQGVIGYKQQLPWHYPKDLKFFTDTVKNQCIIMGYRTFVTTPAKILCNCHSIVFSRNHVIKKDNVHTIASVQEFKQLNLPNISYMIGGGQISELLISNNLVEEFILTEITKSYHGDAFFSLQLLKHWDRQSLHQEKDFSINHYIKN